MAEAVVPFVVETIGKLPIDEAKFLWGVEGKVKKLQKELKLIQGLLRDADIRREPDEAVPECVTQLRDIAYDSEDVIERYILTIAPKKEQNIIKAYACFVAKCKWVQAHIVGTKIDGLKSSISNLRKSMQAYDIQLVNEGERKRTRALMPKRTYAHYEEDFFGREDSIEELVKELLKDGKQHRVISIWGMGGLGKTSLAKKVFAHGKVRNNFTGFAWACISREYHMKDILVDILLQLIPDQGKEVQKMIDQQLFKTLYEIQQKERCIVVLDDIWTKEAWDSLQAAFPVKNTGSKLLITTRNREVAEYIDPQGLFHELQGLSDLESWDLLKKRASRETKVITDDMKTSGDELLKKCGGLPLAIIVLGGLLAVNGWEMVHEIKLYFSDKSDVLQVLALSYDDLPWHLKPCFLYLASFPEDEEIPVRKVLHMWIAEGFVSPTSCGEGGEITVEDRAEGYLMELVKRGMVQGQFKSSGKIETCNLHDLMRDLCISKARQERFLSILNIRQDHDTKECSSSIGMEGEPTCKTRRLSLNMRGSAKGNGFLRVEHLRTLMFFYSGGFDGGMWEQFRLLCINNKFLRVLKLERLIGVSGNLPEAVGDLVHLRYLSLAGSDFEGLPQSMGNLVCMEFLDLCMSKNVTVPNVLWKMRRLRYLRLPDSFTVKEKFYRDQKKLRLDTLKSLQTLKNFHWENCDVNDLGKLTNLRKLTLASIKDQLEIFPQLAKFNLKQLKSSTFYFVCNLDRSFTEGELSKMSNYPHPCKISILGVIKKLPEHKNLSQQLRKLFLIWSNLEEDPMPILEKLNHLVVLGLGHHAFRGKKMVCSAGGFPQLKRLFLSNLRNLKEWRVAEGAMTHLSRLGIRDCPELKTVPKEVSHVYRLYPNGLSKEDRRDFIKIVGVMVR